MKILRHRIKVNLLRFREDHPEYVSFKYFSPGKKYVFYRSGRHFHKMPKYREYWWNDLKF